MSKAFFEELNIPEHSYFFNAGSDIRAEQLVHIMIEFKKVIPKQSPGYIIDVEDVNSTSTFSIAAKRLNAKLLNI